MKLSLFTLILNDRSVEETIRLVSEIGYDGIEFQGRAPHLPSDISLDRAGEISRMTKEAGLSVPIIATYTGGYSTMNDKECQKQLDELQRYMEIADALGCKMLRHLVGDPSPRKAEAHHWERTAEWMQKAADIAAQGGFRLAMELHFGNLIEGAEPAMRLLKMINRKNVGVIHDPGNLFIARTEYGSECIRKLGDRIFHVHFKDEIAVPDSSYPNSFCYNENYTCHRLLNHGEVDHMQVMKTLTEIGYQGYLSAECHGKNLDREMIARHEHVAMREMLELL